MKNIVPTQFTKKQPDSNRSFNALPLKSNNDLPVKKTSLHLDANIKNDHIKTDSIFKQENNNKYQSFNKPQAFIDKDINDTGKNGCKLSQITSKPIKYNVTQQRQKVFSPSRNQFSPPNQLRVGSSPTYEPKNDSYLGVRNTLKQMISGKGRDKTPNENRLFSPKQSKNIKTMGQLPSHSPHRAIQKQNQILRSQNQMLKNELNEIKRHILFSNSSKKQDIISNLRDTIKKQDSQIKQLRIKLQIALKKNINLSSILQTKDQQILFMNNKVQQLQNEIRQYRDKNSQKMQNLKQKLALLVRCYGQLQTKVGSQQNQWISFKQKWAEEKGMYLHRISFLQKYIAAS